jgi:RNA polymerase sigma-70 factor (ECF subfamily)
MTPSSKAGRLSNFSTQWTLVHRAAGGPADAETAAQAALLERYGEAIHSYLLGAVHDPEAADELYQEFALRFLRGDFRRSHPERGRFRNLVKTALINLVINYQKRERARGRYMAARDVAAEAAPADPEAEDALLTHWRRALLDAAWKALAARQSADGPPFYEVLRSQTEHPEILSARLAEQLTADRRPGAPFSAVGVRKILQRAREAFAELLVEEVAGSLPNPSRADLEEELIDLGFYAYCRRALERRYAE